MMMMTIIKNEGGFFVAAAVAECKCTLITMKVVMIIIITFMNIIHLSNLSTPCSFPIHPSPKAHVEDYEMKKKILVSEK